MKRKIDLVQIHTANRRLKIEEDMIRGVLGSEALALRHGVGVKMIEADKAMIYAKWRADHAKNVRDKRLWRISVLEGVIRSASVEYERSGDARETVQTKYEKVMCGDCEGRGLVRGKKCKTCEGEGTVVEEVITKSVTGQCRDPRYLMLVKECVREIGRIQGEPKRKVSAESEQVQKHLHVHLDHWNEADPEDLLAAKVIVERMSDRQKKLGRGKILDG